MLQSSTQVRLSGFRHTDVHITSASPAGRQVQLAHTSRGSKQNRTELTHHMGCGVGGVGSTRPAPSLRFSQPVRIEAFAEPARWLARAHAVNERREAAPHHDAVGDADDVAVQRGAGAAEERRGLAAAVKEEVGQVEEAEDAEAHECERGVVPGDGGEADGVSVRLAEVEPRLRGQQRFVHRHPVVFIEALPHRLVDMRRQRMRELRPRRRRDGVCKDALHSDASGGVARVGVLDLVDPKQVADDAP
mmetsp:Transcript_25000/g.67063  ORF Transcript_25000/g.67063 Transcript_25000/m.67063 type:complete len:247 (+) Transcript_25000:42-782(+)